MIKRIIIAVAAVLVLVAAFALKGPRNGDVSADANQTVEQITGSETDPATPPPSTAGTERPGAQPSQAGLPRLVDLGADKCIPCKKMAPILEELSETYAGVFEVEFIDVWKNRAAAGQWGIRVIPTQVFIDAGGVEQFRHQGFMSREAILDKWRELGVELPPSPSSEES